MRKNYRVHYFSSYFCFVIVIIMATSEDEYLDDFDGEESDEDICEPPPKRRRTVRTWLKVRTYNSKEEAEQFVTDERVRLQQQFPIL